MIESYFQKDDITIYCGDCLEIMPQLEPVDLVLTDPPYNVGKNFGKQSDDNRADYNDWCDKWFKYLNASAILLTPGISNLKAWMNRDLRWVIAWTKSNSMKRITIGFNCWEPILLWGKPKINTYRDLFDAPTIPKSSGHITPKPLKLYLQLIAGFSDVNQTILDPFMGSGTTLVAAKQFNRKAIGIEIEEKYCEIAVNRIEKAIKRDRMSFHFDRKEEKRGEIWN